jgi:hypothetical protein
VRHLIEEYRRFLRTSYRFLDPHLRDQFEAHLAQADVVVRGPYVRGDVVSYVDLH